MVYMQLSVARATGPDKSSIDLWKGAREGAA
jgi:hypothetical protein